MATLISVHNSDGCIGRCDAKCYNAAGPHCNCICSGMNHGAGLVKAADNTGKYADKWIEKYREEKNLPDATAKVNPKLKELPLPPF